MRMRSILLATLVLAACATRPPFEAQRASPSTIHANDNRSAAGSHRNAALTLRLEIAEGSWQPERALAPFRVLAFGEPGAPLSTPGPLIRIRQGTIVDVSIRNLHDADVFVHGLHDRPGTSPPLRVPAHGGATVRFQATRAGSYYYWGTLADALDQREARDSQLTGALIVDPPDGSQEDRVFVIGRLGSIGDGLDIDSGLGAWVINGQSWPDTERLTYRVGEPVRWRWINATGHRHPMHLHGTYFSVISAGDNAVDVPRAAGERNPVVTHAMQPGSTMAMTWSPMKPGNWLFHCHNLFHVMPDNRLPLPNWYDEYATLPHDQHMAGLVLGIHALAAADAAVEDASARPRRIVLRVGERPGVHYETPGLSAPGLGYAVDSGPVTAPGSTIVLERNRPVEIDIVSAITHATAVHWHGIELDSYYDGVPHWGGDARNVTPHIAPGATFTARFTPPRAGTFIYHTHFNDYVQLATGLYGALVVVEPGRTFDDAVDHVFVISQDGLDDQKDALLMNGAVELAPMQLRAGAKHRFRFVGITASLAARVRLTRDGEPIAWRSLAKDGADLPEALATSSRADFEIYPGETYDFELVAGAHSPLRLEATLQRASGQQASVPIIVEP